ncbi:thiol:disulfide interchange protein [Vibrio sp. UCD-FRSSP16_10]|uniref:thiol:disulfide interchange protein DsbA/DsbL n=1 Tax=unclassified Vibrio TaxID=2614977 RepID=UPI0007FDF6E5|nr:MULTISPECIES: thiol:disulfide interchange protein DsbA/DsbL [unclassified Vibrio]OBT15641.1 thiol:disulfide interchange protein [Vibrio sp. UCD-FRSSP16_30]OBT21051.1 thiol:disulfide interchange protein [Vibrio sp. UCD-FRSSP16_10]
MNKLIAFVATIFLSLSVHAAQFTEGQNYKVLDLPAASSPTVNEFFSFYCPHCHHFEPIINNLKKALPANAKFQKSHVSFMGGNMGTPMSKAYATMIALEVEDQMIPVMFDLIHNKNAAPRTEQQLRQIFLDNGISAKKFDAAYNGFAVDSMVRRFDKQFKDSGLTGVPSIVINNKYLVEISSIKSSEDLNNLVNYLLKLK